MKPHIRKVRGVWCCASFRWNGDLPSVAYMFPLGHGYTVREAYEDWRIQMEAQRA